MSKHFHEIEEVVADELFLGWYYRQSPEQVAAWEKWLADNPDQQDLVKQAIGFMDSLPKSKTVIPAQETETRLAQLNKRIDGSSTPVVSMRTSRKRWWITAAAAVIVLLIGTFTVFKLTQSKKQYGTKYGEICSNQLPDGSTMILNANSTARLSDEWDETKDREVWLKGEAFFKVTKTAARSRFIVHTENLDVIVTGTQFNVMHRNDKTSVLLTEGSVIIRTHEGKEIAMKPGDYIEMAGQLVKTEIAKQENILAWKENKMAFNNVTLKDAADIISNHYGVKIKLADSAVAAEPLNGMMPNDNLEVLLEAIEVATNIKITKTGEEITFSSVN
jgi:transmembrane sensor